MKTFANKAKALRQEFESVTGIRPRYPRSLALYSALSDTLDQFKKGQYILDPGVKNLFVQDEFNCLGKININDNK